MSKQLHSYEPMLKESVKHFIASYYSNGGEASNFSAFESIFFRLIQTMPDPSLEITWFYSAVTSHASKLTPLTTPAAKILLVKDLFQFLISCSNSSTSVRKIVILAPVICELYHIICEFTNDELCLLKSEVEDLVDKIVSYVTICCEDNENVDEVDNVVVCIKDLVRVWTLDRVAESCKFGDNMRVFFPVLSGELREGVLSRSRIEELAGLVLCEVFFMRLCLKFDSVVLREELLINAQHWAIHTIKGFRNYYFLDGLFRMLLESSLPVSTLLSSEDTLILQKVLYDAAVLVDYSFLFSGRWIQSPDKLRRLALVWSLVADNAIQFARRMYDEARVISYGHAFLESSFLNQLTVWITNQTNMEEKLKPNICTPRALIRWLLALEDQGLRLFNDDVLKVRAKAVVSNWGPEHGLPEFNQHGKIPQENICFYNEHHKEGGQEVNGDQEMIDSYDDACPNGVSLTNTATNVGRKRKEGKEDVGGTRVKLSKYNCHETSIEENLLPFSHGDTVNAGSG